MNLQVISKQDLREDGSLFVHSIFPTIQGEGPHSGRRAIFVRLAGCNLQCPFCDTAYTIEMGIPPMSVEQIAQAILGMMEDWREPESSLQSPLVVLTGGEPFRQNIQPLVQTLLEGGYHVQIETNGTMFVDLWSQLPPHRVEEFLVVCSPKTGKINPELAMHVDALKYVLHADSMDSSDGLPLIALGHSAFPKVFRPLPEMACVPTYITPCDEQDEGQNARHRKAVVASAMKFGHIAQLQVHKVFGIQ